VAMCCTARIDRWPWLVYVAFTLQYIHTCINFYFILFYFTLPILNSRVVGRSTWHLYLH
jgi:hypothetical protein